MGIPISNVTRRVVYAASGTGPYNFTFEILANTDVAVYKDDALLTLTTDYTVTINANGTGYITLTASPTGATQIAIVGNRTIQRTTDFVTGGDFFANTVNDEMDQQTIFAQQNAEGLQRALQAPQTDPTSIDMTLPRAAIRANKVLSFDANGNPSATEFIGSNRGNWAAGTLYYVRDIIKDTSTSNIWQCVVEHTSSGSQPIGTNADAAKWFLLVDAASAGASATAAAASASAAATSASNASTSATNAASSASTASTQASNASTSATNAANSATAAASSASTASTQASNAATSATNAANSATSASNSASTATTQATNASNSATSAATSASQASTSASNAASSASAASTSASNAATSATNAANSATASANSATAAAASAAAAAASFDAFDDIYLGAKSSDPTVDNDGDALTVGDQYFNTVANELRVYNGSTWQAASTVGGTVSSINVTGATTLAQNPTLSAGTANGVAYLNGSKVLTTGSALTFDGTNLGVGTSSPAVKLHAYGSGTYVAGIESTSAFAYLGLRASGSGGSMSDPTVGIGANANDLAFRANGSEQMRLTSTGLGIGTSSPGVKLDVAGGDIRITSASAPSLYVNNTSASGKNYRLISADSGNLIIQNTGIADLVYLNTAGNLGLGVTPSAWGSAYRALQVNGSAVSASGTVSHLTLNAYFNGTNWIRLNNSYGVMQYEQDQFYGHAWKIAGSGSGSISFTQAMTLDASGNLLVGGTSSNGAKVVAYQGSAQSPSTSGNMNTGFMFGQGVTDPILNFGTDADGVWYNAAYGNNAGIGRIHRWLTGGTERARIDSSGNLQLGLTGGSARLNVAYTYPTTGANWFSDVSESHYAITFNNSNGLVGSITTGGSTTAYNTSSDYRLKENIQPMTGALAKVATLKPCTYKWKADGSDGEGFIAHELAEVVPQCVTGEKDAVDADGNPVYQGIDTSFLVATLTAAIQELKAELDSVKSELASLKG